MKKVLIVDNYDSFTYNLAQYLEEAGARVEVWKNDRVALRKVNEFDKILFSPGPDLPDKAPVLFDILREYGHRKSILGVCLGHQAIGQFFGGSLYQLPDVMHGIAKTTTILMDDELLFHGLPRQFEVGLYHSWAVAEKDFPPALEITARTADGTVMALRHRQFDLRGVQFHPESWITSVGKEMVRNWVEMVDS